MANEPKPAKEKRPDPGSRPNAQGDHEGSSHRPEEFKRGQPDREDETDGGSNTPSDRKTGKS